MAKYASSWSGGKDSCFALWKAIEQGLEVKYLLNITETSSKRSMSHGLNRELIALQAAVLGLPLLQREATWQTYETQFKTALEQLRRKGISGLVTGDIYLQEHKDWIKRVCGETGLEAVLPLWQLNTSQLLFDFIDTGFKAIIISVKSDPFNESWLGRTVDKDLVADLQQLATEVHIDPCGEHGEFHTFVYDGPLFHRPIHIENMETVARDGYLFLDMKEFRVG